MACQVTFRIPRKLGQELYPWHIYSQIERPVPRDRTTPNAAKGATERQSDVPWRTAGERRERHARNGWKAPKKNDAKPVENHAAGAPPGRRHPTITPTDRRLPPTSSPTKTHEDTRQPNTRPNKTTRT
ncbi:hypothetical protein CHUAL_004279 [Chamberlinius hualienensis]